MKPKTEQPITAVTLHAHPPERKRRRANEILSQLNGCCCCCCCCLHSVGSLTGAVLGSLTASRDPAVDQEKAPVKFIDDELAGWPPPTAPSARLPVNGIYWGSLLVVMILLSLYMLTQAAFPNAGAGILFILAIFLPLIQLGASVLSAFVLACSPSYSREGRAWAQLWRITLGTFVGAVVGSLIMVLLGVIISASRR